ncbi:asparagine synthase [Paraphysoderma sedebokerense]|nr:asparagine synthase [Paraphysoderma sedebokerense]
MRVLQSRPSYFCARLTQVSSRSSPSSSSSAKIAILFSGGIDCTVLALLTHLCIPEHESIDLLNVAFENPRIMEARKKERENGKGKGKKRKGKSKQKGSNNNGDNDDVAANVGAENSEVGIAEEKFENDVVNNDEEVREEIYDVPDRKTGRQGLEELRLLAPNRRWNFVEINIPYSEAMDKKLDILELMSPLDTIMDLSIAMAFWFSARGKGYIRREGKAEPYETPAKVLISGLGADEQLGGYGRHRVQYNKESWGGLAKEIKMDVERIWTRNLGRDDRIISSHSREPRFPYLSAPVVNYLSSLPVYLKCDPRFDKGIGDKILIRLLAKKLGLEKTSVEAKRAVQFGSRTAKMGETSTKEKGMMKVDLA